MLKKIFNRGHGRFLEMLSDYFDGELPEAERIALEAHLQGCDSCTEEMESLRATVQMLRRMPEVEAPRSFRLAPATVTAPTPPPERPVFLMGDAGLDGPGGRRFHGDGGGQCDRAVRGWAWGWREGVGFLGSDEPISDRHPCARGYDGADRILMPTEEPDAAMPDRPRPQAMMESEPDMIPKSTPMMMAERTATPEPEAMMEFTAMPDEEAAIDTSVTISEADDSSVAGAPILDPDPTTAPALTATPRPRPTTAPIPSPTLMPRATPAPTMDFRTRPDPTPTPEPWAWASSEEKDDGGNGVVLGLEVGLGALAAALALGTLYITVRRRRVAG